MNNELYFHDGNFVSISINEFHTDPIVEIVLNLKIQGTPDRKNFTLRISEVTRLSLLGDFIEMKNNYWAGSIEDGRIDDVAISQRLTMTMTGGFLEIFGKISIS